MASEPPYAGISDPFGAHHLPSGLQRTDAGSGTASYFGSAGGGPESPTSNPFSFVGNTAQSVQQSLANSSSGSHPMLSPLVDPGSTAVPVTMTAHQWSTPDTQHQQTTPLTYSTEHPSLRQQSLGSVKAAASTDMFGGQPGELTEDPFESFSVQQHPRSNSSQSQNSDSGALGISRGSYSAPVTGLVGSTQQEHGGGGGNDQTAALANLFSLPTLSSGPLIERPPLSPLLPPQAASTVTNATLPHSQRLPVVHSYPHLLTNATNAASSSDQTTLQQGTNAVGYPITQAPCQMGNAPDYLTMKESGNLRPELNTENEYLTFTKEKMHLSAVGVLEGENSLSSSLNHSMSSLLDSQEDIAQRSPVQILPPAPEPRPPIKGPPPPPPQQQQQPPNSITHEHRAQNDVPQTFTEDPHSTLILSQGVAQPAVSQFLHPQPQHSNNPSPSLPDARSPLLAQSTSLSSAPTLPLNMPPQLVSSPDPSHPSITPINASVSGGGVAVQGREEEEAGSFPPGHPLPTAPQETAEPLGRLPQQQQVVHPPSQQSPVVHPLNVMQQLPQASPIQPQPPESSVVQSPPVSTRVQLPPPQMVQPQASTLPMSSVGRPPQPPVSLVAQPPPPMSSVVQPQVSTLVQMPPQSSSMVQPPPQVAQSIPQMSSVVQPPPQMSSVVQPPLQMSSVVQPPQMSSVVQPQQSSSVVQPPLQMSSVVQLPPQMSSVVQPPPQMSSVVQPPPQSSSVVQPPPQMSSVVQPLSSTVQLPPQTSSTVLPLPQVSSTLPPVSLIAQPVQQLVQPPPQSFSALQLPPQVPSLVQPPPPQPQAYSAAPPQERTNAGTHYTSQMSASDPVRPPPQMYTSSTAGTYQAMPTDLGRDSEYSHTVERPHSQVSTHSNESLSITQFVQSTVSNTPLLPPQDPALSNAHQPGVPSNARPGLQPMHSIPSNTHPPLMSVHSIPSNTHPPPMSVQGVLSNTHPPPMSVQGVLSNAHLPQYTPQSLVTGAHQQQQQQHSTVAVSTSENVVTQPQYAGHDSTISTKPPHPQSVPLNQAPITNNLPSTPDSVFCQSTSEPPLAVSNAVTGAIPPPTSSGPVFLGQGGSSGLPSTPPRVNLSHIHAGSSVTTQPHTEQPLSSVKEAIPAVPSSVSLSSSAHTVSGGPGGVRSSSHMPYPHSSTATLPVTSHPQFVPTSVGGPMTMAQAPGTVGAPTSHSMSVQHQPASHSIATHALSSAPSVHSVVTAPVQPQDMSAAHVRTTSTGEQHQHQTQHQQTSTTTSTHNIKATTSTATTSNTTTTTSTATAADCSPESSNLSSLLSSSLTPSHGGTTRPPTTHLPPSSGLRG